MDVAKGATVSCQYGKGHTTIERTWWRHHRKTNNIVFGYLSVILAPFRTLFGYFWLKKPGNPGTVHNCENIRQDVKTGE